MDRSSKQRKNNFRIFVRKAVKLGAAWSFFLPGTCPGYYELSIPQGTILGRPSIAAIKTLVELAFCFDCLWRTIGDDCLSLNLARLVAIESDADKLNDTGNGICKWRLDHSETKGQEVIMLEEWLFRKNMDPEYDRLKYQLTC